MERKPIIEVETDFSDISVAIIGGTGGIGRAMASFLAEKGAQVIVVGRTYREDSPNISFIGADLSTVAEMKRAAKQLPAPDLDMLIFTSGILPGYARALSADGIEMDMAVSYLSRFVMLRELAPSLGANRPGRPAVFIMGFPGLSIMGGGCPDDLNSESPCCFNILSKAGCTFNPIAAHMNTVVANEALVLDAARRYSRIAIFGLNPGLIATGIRTPLLGSGPLFHCFERGLSLCTPTTAAYAETMVPILASAQLRAQSGFLLAQDGTPLMPSRALTPEVVEAFTNMSEELVIIANDHAPQPPPRSAAERQAPPPPTSSAAMW
jgi:NAD(P)-dependent dehydrogenase (short-subunit alcohol dehydrogenase family)